MRVCACEYIPIVASKQTTALPCKKMPPRTHLQGVVCMQAGHAIIGALLPEYDPVTKISIIPRGAAGGATFFAPNEEQLESGLFTRSYLENKLAVALGGRVAEEIILGPDDVTTGASGDFQQVRVESRCARGCTSLHARP